MGVIGQNSALDQLIRPAVEGLGYECWGIELVPQGKRSLLRIYIDRLPGEAVEDDEQTQSGIGLKDCETVSRHVSGILDVEDPISGDYVLEVSSPGLDRPLYELKHFDRFKGHSVKLKLRMSFEGRKKYAGILVGIEGNDVVVQVDEEEFLFPVDSIEKANIVPKFD